jgi:cytochrome c biogenesis protein CcdA
MTPQSFRAPWGNVLKISTAVFTALIVVIMIISGKLGLFLGALILAIGILMIVRGYSVQAGQVIVHGLVWNKVYPLIDLCDIESQPFATVGSIRTFGIGGFFSFWGYYHNPTLGSYLSFVTDAANTVVLKFENTRIVLSPDDPVAFVEAVRREYRRIRV